MPGDYTDVPVVHHFLAVFALLLWCVFVMALAILPLLILRLLVVGCSLHWLAEGQEAEPGRAQACAARGRAQPLPDGNHGENNR